VKNQLLNIEKALLNKVKKRKVSRTFSFLLLNNETENPRFMVMSKTTNSKPRLAASRGLSFCMGFAHTKSLTIFAKSEYRRAVASKIAKNA